MRSRIDRRRAVFLRDLPRLRLRRFAINPENLQQDDRWQRHGEPLPVQLGTNLTRSGGAGAKELVTVPAAHGSRQFHFVARKKKAPSGVRFGAEFTETDYENLSGQAWAFTDWSTVSVSIPEKIPPVVHTGPGGFTETVKSLPTLILLCGNIQLPCRFPRDCRSAICIRECVSPPATA